MSYEYRGETGLTKEVFEQYLAVLGWNLEKIEGRNDIDRWDKEQIHTKCYKLINHFGKETQWRLVEDDYFGWEVVLSEEAMFYLFGHDNSDNNTGGKLPNGMFSACLLDMHVNREPDSMLVIGTSHQSGISVAFCGIGTDRFMSSVKDDINKMTDSGDMREMLLKVGEDIPKDCIREWKSGEYQIVKKWAINKYLKETTSIYVVVPNRPKILG